MQRLLRLTFLLTSLAVLPVLAVAQNTKKDAKVDETAIRNRILSGSIISGKLTVAMLEGEDKSITVAYVQQTKKLNTDVQKKMQQVSTQAAKVAKDKAQLAKLKTEYDTLAATLYDVEETLVPFDCKFDKTVIVRTMIPPMEDGKPKKLSADELKRLKGDGKSPGYLSSLPDLDPGTHFVQAYIDKAKFKPAPAAKPTDKKEADKKDDDKTENGEKIPITMIVIVQPPAGANTKGGVLNPFGK